VGRFCEKLRRTAPRGMPSLDFWHAYRFEIVAIRPGQPGGADARIYRPYDAVDCCCYKRPGAGTRLVGRREDLRKDPVCSVASFRFALPPKLVSPTFSLFFNIKNFSMTLIWIALWMSWMKFSGELRFRMMSRKLSRVERARSGGGVGGGWRDACRPHPGGAETRA
jgi:hypothetical protein